MPPLILGALERRAATPFTLSLSEMLVIWVSIVALGSVAAGGVMSAWRGESGEVRDGGM